MELSTIVEIVENYQPSLLPLLGNASTTVEIMRHTSQSGRRSRHRNLQQQKLLKHTSPHLSIIYHQLSTIVEIIEAYQPLAQIPPLPHHLQQQKLLKHTSQRYTCKHRRHLQQQKLQKHTSRRAGRSPVTGIYNSRNYRSILARYSVVS